jgi:chromosome segregation ATPase
VSEPNLASSALAAADSHAAPQQQPAEQLGDGQLQATMGLDAGSDRTNAGDDSQQKNDTRDETQYLEPLQGYLTAWAAAHHELNTIDPGFIETLRQQATAALKAQRHSWEREQAAMQAELRQTRLLSHEQVERIRHLEQALDQSLASLSEMRLQVVDQQRLEAQLAATEDISNIQQRAIARLKLQLAHQQQALTAQLTETQARDRSLQTLLNTMEALTQAQQQELEQLQTQVAYDRTDVQAYRQQLEEQLEQLQTDLQTQQARTIALESQSLDAQTLASQLTERLERAYVQVSELSQILSNRQIALEQLETELQQTHTTLREQQTWLDSLQQARLSHVSATSRVPPLHATPDDGSALAIAPDLVTAHAKIAALETQAAKQTTTQAMLRHACQELEEERDRQYARLTELENQTTDMQEQILRQAQQASEYETAIQHWKDRCFSSQSGILKLKELLDQALPDAPPALSELLTTLLAAADEAEPGSPTLLPMSPFPRETKVDLPDFLLRRRNYKPQRS